MNDNLKLKIESYISNSMSKEEHDLFEKEIKKNPELKKEINLAKELNHFLIDEYLDYKPSNKKSKKELKEFLKSDQAKNLEETLNKVKNEYHSRKSQPKKLNYFYAAAAVFLLFMSVIAYNFSNQTTPETLFAQYYSTNDLPSVIKRDNNNDAFKQGVLKFQSKNYKDAISDFKHYESNNKSIDKRMYLYSGIANMELKNYEIAIQDFDKIIQSDLLDNSKGLWFKALLYLKKQDIEKSKNVLEIILKSKTNFKYEAAKKLLEKL
jgi:hypothetical protein